MHAPPHDESLTTVGCGGNDQNQLVEFSLALPRSREREIVSDFFLNISFPVYFCRGHTF